MTPWAAGTECPYDFYPEFKKLLNDASYHFADDSSKEWALGYLLVEDAAAMVADRELPFWVIERMRREAGSMVDTDLFMNKVLAYLYRNKGV